MPITTLTPPTFTAVCRGPNLIGVVAVDGDSWMYHMAYNETGWHLWTTIGNGFVSEAPALISSKDGGQLDVFARKRGTNQLMHSSWSDEGWAVKWDEDSESPAFNRKLVAEPVGDGKIAVFGTSEDRLYNRLLVDGDWQGGWEGWNGTYRSDLTLASWSDGTLGVFGIGTNGQMWQKTCEYAAGGCHTYWDPPSNVLYGPESAEGEFLYDPTVVAESPGQLQLLVVCSLGDKNATLCYREYHDRKWSDYQDIGGEWAESVAAISRSEGSLDVVGSDGSFPWYLHLGSGDRQWQPGATNLSGEKIGMTPALVSCGSERLDVFTVAREGDALMQRSLNGSTWTDDWILIGQLPNQARLKSPSSGVEWKATASIATATAWSPVSTVVSGTSSSASAAAAALSNRSGLESGAAIGLAVGASAGVAALVMALFWVWRTFHKRKRMDEGSIAALQVLAKTGASELQTGESSRYELHENQMKHILMSNTRHELEGSRAPR